MDAIVKMQPPTYITGLRSFIGAVPFHRKFIPNLSVMTEPLTSLHTDMFWMLGAERAASSISTSQNNTLQGYNPGKLPHIPGDRNPMSALNVGIGIMLFHCYRDGNERPITNASKTLSHTQFRNSQIQWKALAVICGREYLPLSVWTKVHLCNGKRSHQ